MPFIADKPTAPVQSVPFLEDITAKDVPGAGVTKEPEYYQKGIKKLLEEMGAARVEFVPGVHNDRLKRYGYQIVFRLNGIPGRIDIAGLPMRTETRAKKERVLAQALYLVREWLTAEMYSSIYRPGAVTLVPFLIGRGGKTVTEELMASGELPNLNPALPKGDTGDTVDAVIVEVAS